MIKKSKNPYIRDIYLAYLTENAERTLTDNYPIIERKMIALEPPRELIQWDRRRDVIDPANTGMCFYCNDYTFTPVLNNPKAYVEKFAQYACVVGLDPSPYDNMPLVVQKSQIYLNIAATYYYGSCGLKVIPNVRLGDDRTLTCLEAFPKNTLIAIGTHGFVHRLDNRRIFANQINKIVDELEPSGIVVYGIASKELFGSAISKGIPIYQYDSYTMKQNKITKVNKVLMAIDHCFEEAQ